MFRRLRKLLTIIIIIVECLCVNQIISADGWSHDIETSDGIKTIILPEGMTFEEAYIEMSKLYIEERLDHEALIAQTQDLIAKSKEFEEASVELQALQKELAEKTEELSNLYKKLGRVHPVYFLTTAGITTGTLFQTVDSINVGFGVELFETWLTILEVSYPWTFGVKVGVRF